ncbi:MAG: hypothetical protein MZV70_43095 [Desulfobacterales bacterium]|nr:hypothetical protein [Desulfobacterales bacterium]
MGGIVVAEGPGADSADRRAANRRHRVRRAHAARAGQPARSRVRSFAEFHQRVRRPVAAEHAVLRGRAVLRERRRSGP